MRVAALLILLSLPADASVQDDGLYTAVPEVYTEGQYIAAMPEAKAEELPEMWMFTTAGCRPCESAKKAIAAEKNLPFRLVIKDTIPPGYEGKVDSFPTFYWRRLRSSGTIETFYEAGWHGLPALRKRWDATSEKHKAKVAPKVKAKTVATPKIHFGNPWTEGGHGATPRHLINDHGIPKWVVDKYRGNQSALDRLHGAAHERGSVF